MAIFAQQTIDLNLVPGAVLPVVNVSQYDSAYLINFRLYNGSQRFDIPTAVNLRMDMTKPDKHGVSAVVSKNSAIPSMCYVGLTEQMTAVAGDCICEIVLIHNTDNKRIGTINFIMRVEPAAIRDDTIISDSALNTVQQKIDQWSGLAAYGDALNALINSRGSSSQYGLVKIWNNANTTPSDWGEQGTAYAPDISLVTSLYGMIAKEVYVGSPAGFVFGDTFDANTSYVYCVRMHDVIFVTFAARVKADKTVPAATNRNIVTNLPPAMTRVYVQAFTVTYDTSGETAVPTGITPVMCAIRPEESASNSNQILKVDAGINPTAVASNRTIFGSFTYIANDR